MYWLDPDRGRRRRALVRDRVAHLRRVGDDAISATAADVANRARGLVAEAAALLRHESVPDDVLAERVRARLGLSVSHPGAITVTVCEGVIGLDGQVLAAEIQPLVARVRRTRGVRGVENRLDVHRSPEAVPALQGGEGSRGTPLPFLGKPWSPTARLFVGAAGLGLVGWGMRRGRLLGSLLAALGVGVLAGTRTSRPLAVADATP
jgi:hypothetical protein